MDEECNFGFLTPIFLPPQAVSIPRTEVPMEAIIGVQVRRKETLSRKTPYSPYNSSNLTLCLQHEVHRRSLAAVTLVGTRKLTKTPNITVLLKRNKTNRRKETMKRTKVQKIIIGIVKNSSIFCFRGCQSV